MFFTICKPLREIQNTTESDSDSDIDSSSGDIVEVDGWETEFDSTRSKEERSEDFSVKLIKLANKKANLNTILKSYNISFSNIVNSPTGWTHNTICPFKDHNDKSPSFWFNPEFNRFNCFGCSRSGGPVFFVSIYTGKKPNKVAEDLLQIYGNFEDIVEEINEELQEKIDNLVLDSSEYFKIFMKNHQNSPVLIKFAENLLWSLDVYLEKLNFAKSNVELENLEARINIMKRKLAKFE